MKILLLNLVVLIASTKASAQMILPTIANYESGRALCEQKYASIVAHEKGFYVSVPADYNNPAAGTTDVYAFFASAYNPTKDTVVYFNGGPGSPAHWGLLKEEIDLGLNILLIEQRGIGCSRPPSLKQYLNPKFYSSEFVARDAEVIRQFLKIDRWSVYGVSYGTVPAMIYASLFPKSSRALVLEGTVYAGDDDLTSNPHRRKLLQKLLNSLPKNILARLDMMTTVYHMPDIWFSDLTRGFLTSNDGLETLRASLLTLGDDDSFNSLLKQVHDMYEPITYVPHVLFTSNDVVYYMIGCQELGFSSPGAVTADSFVGGLLIAKAPHSEVLKNCNLLQVSGTQKYVSSHYPVTVPVTYFQGSDDGAVSPAEAFQQYKNVPQGPKQLMILVKGGHLPNLENLRAEVPLQKEIFLQAVRGLAITPELLQRAKSVQKLKWTYTSKNF
jgi:proline iminopeptidase